MLVDLKKSGAMVQKLGNKLTALVALTAQQVRRLDHPVSSLGMRRSITLAVAATLALVLPTKLSATPPVEHDPPEPVAPQIECNVKESPVYCEDGVPTLTALQRAPFEWCRVKLPASKTALGGTSRLFSAAQTRVARKTRSQACCYVEWTWSACR
jgi:hypothetical protein